MSEHEPVTPVSLADFLDRASQCTDWRAKADHIKPFIEALVDCRRSLLLAERDALLSRAASIFQCSESSLLTDLRRARVEKAKSEVQAEIADLDRWFAQ